MENQDIKNPLNEASSEIKDSPRATFLILVLVIVAIGCGAVLYMRSRLIKPAAVSPIAGQNIKQLVPDGIVNTIEQKIPIIVATGNNIAEIDVDGDGKKDVVRYSQTPDDCGSGGCRLYINEKVVLANAYPPIYFLFKGNKLAELFVSQSIESAGCTAESCMNIGLVRYVYDSMVATPTIDEDNIVIPQNAVLLFANDSHQSKSTSFKTYVASDFGFSFQYPTYWKVENDQSYTENGARVYPISIYDTRKNYMSDGTVQEVVGISVQPDIFNGSIYKYIDPFLKAGYSEDFIKGETVMDGRRAYILQGESPLNPIHGYRDMRVVFIDKNVVIFYNHAKLVAHGNEVASIGADFQKILSSFKVTGD